MENQVQLKADPPETASEPQSRERKIRLEKLFRDDKVAIEN